MIRWLALALAVIFACGCADDTRAKHAADARAGLQAAAEQAPGVAAILAGVDQRLPAVSGVNSADWPTPEWSPARIKADPAAYGQSAPPEPSRLGMMAVLGAAGLAALAALRVVAPLIPGGGPLVKMVADGVWNVIAHRDQKAADQAQASMIAAANAARPILLAMRELSASQFPPSLAQALRSPVASAAIDHLAQAHLGVR